MTKEETLEKVQTISARDYAETYHGKTLREYVPKGVHYSTFFDLTHPEDISKRIARGLLEQASDAEVITDFRFSVTPIKSGSTVGAVLASGTALYRTTKGS